MAKVMRYMIADYLKTGSTPSDTYSLMGTGFTTLDENPAAKVEKTPYINDKSASGTITGYENSFAFDTQMISATRRRTTSALISTRTKPPAHIRRGNSACASRSPVSPAPARRS